METLTGSAPSPSTVSRVFHTLEVARGVKAPLLAVHFKMPWRQMTPDDAASLRANMELAVDLGAEVETIDSAGADDIPTVLAQLAQERHITQIVIGNSERKPWAHLFKPSMANRLLGLVTQDVHIVSPSMRERSRTLGDREKEK